MSSKSEDSTEIPNPGKSRKIVSFKFAGVLADCNNVFT